MWKQYVRVVKGVYSKRKMKSAKPLLGNILPIIPHRENNNNNTCNLQT